MNKELVKDALKVNLITLIVFAFMYVFYNSAFSFFSTGKDGVWLLSKYVTFKNNGNAPIYDDNILICSIEGVNSRDSIATIIEKIDSYGPKAIGCDIIFSASSGIDSLHDAHLKAAVEGNERIVVAQRPVLDGLGNLSSVEESVFENVTNGDVTVYSDGSHTRETEIEGRTFVNFSSLVAEKAIGKVKYPSGEFAVDYSNRYFPVMCIDEITPQDVEGKIVLLGDTEDLRDYIDLDFAVTDHRYASMMTTVQRVPGVFLHAYTIASIVDDNWVVMVPKWISLLFGFIASFFLSLLGKYWIAKGIPRCYFKCVHLVLFTFMIWVSYPIYAWFGLIISPLYFTIGVAMSDFSTAGLDAFRHLKGKLQKRKENA